MNRGYKEANDPRHRLTTESIPLEADRTGDYAPNYSTFSPPSGRDRFETAPFWWPLLSYILTFFHPSTSLHERSYHTPKKHEMPWKTIMVLLLCVLISFYHISRGKELGYSDPKWSWDHNVYNPRQGNMTLPLVDVDETRPPNLLLAQVAGNPTLRTLAEISSRPNRAYARQWRRDYVQYSDSIRTLDKTCFDKVLVLHKILDQQLQSKMDLLSLSRVHYDAVALLTPDSIVIDLDCDLWDLMPDDKLVAIAGWKDASSAFQSQSGVVFFNLRHKYARTVAQLWLDMISPAEMTCGANNDLMILIQAIQLVLEDDEEPSSLIHGLDETENGFVGKHVIKVISPAVPGSKEVTLVSNLAETRAILQTTTASVCYRYYPRCEVL